MLDEHQSNFDQWFGDSKVVSGDGKPLVVYHGTTVDIDVFEPNRATEKDSGWYGCGIYFTADPESASNYASSQKSEDNKTSGLPRVMPVYVSLQNPYLWPEGRRAALTPDESVSIRHEIESAGYDGIIVSNAYADEAYATHFEVIAFHPGQIKSAIGNSGLYARENPNIADRIAAAGAALDYLATLEQKKAVPYA